MAASAVDFRVPPGVGLLTAVVALAEPDSGSLRCRVADGSVVRADIGSSVGAGSSLQVGDTVLLARVETGACFVLSVLGGAPREQISTSDGARACVHREPDGEVLRVQDAAGRALFEYRVEDGRCAVFAPKGDLKLQALNGAIELEAATHVRVKAGMDLELESERAAVNVRDVRVEATTVSTVFERVRHVVGDMETRAVRLFESAQVALREVEQLAQTRAGQIRFIAREAFQLRSQRALFKADAEMKLKAEKIHLA